MELNQALAPQGPRTKLARIIKEKGKTQSWVAKTTGLQKSYINHLCKGRITDPHVSTAAKVAAALHVTIEEIF